MSLLRSFLTSLAQRGTRQAAYVKEPEPRGSSIYPNASEDFTRNPEARERNLPLRMSRFYL